MSDRWRSVSPFATALFVLCLTLPGLGYRHLWQDEIETAERARSILESGYPRVIDASGKPSLNLGGAEIEDGPTHRYTPWLQFYVAAIGLAGADLLGASRDASVRLPFVVAHAAASGLVSWSLVAYGGAPVLVANGIASVLGVQSIRIAHNRTSRYHALLDLLILVGVTGLGAFRSGRRWGLALVGGSIFLLPQAHSLAGAVYSPTLALLGATLVFRDSSADAPLAGKIRRVSLNLLLPGIASLVLLLLLTRPWAKSWFEWQAFNLRSLEDVRALGYALLFWLAGGLWILRRGERAAAFPVLGSLVFVVLAVGMAERFPFSQPRYYLSLGLLALSWPVVFGVEWATRVERRWLWRILLAVCLLPELSGWLQTAPPDPRDPEQHWFRPFEGLRLVARDVRAEGSGARQPFHEAMRIIADASEPGDAVLIDYAPQLANWYLPDLSIALMPDAVMRGGINARNPIWDEPLEPPDWHLWYPSFGSGTWFCLNHCDFQVVEREEDGRYWLRSARLDRRFEMCPVEAWRTNHWNNAPFMNLQPSSASPAGDPWGYLLLARPCNALPARTLVPRQAS